MHRLFLKMATNSYDKIIKDATNVANSDYFGYSAGEGLGNSILGHYLMPGLEQDKEFGQTIALQQYQNEWNSETAKMARAKDAGINPHVAAGQIAGSSSPSASSPNTAVGAGAAAVDAASNAVNAATSAYEKLELTPSEKSKRNAEVSELLSKSLHNEWLAKSIAEILPEQKSNQRADTYLKLAEYDKALEDKKLITKRISEAEEHISVLKEQAKLYEEQGDLVRYQQNKTQYETAQLSLQNDKLQWDKDWRARYRYDPNNPVDVALEQAMVNGAGEDVVGAIGQSVDVDNYNRASSDLRAQVEAAFDLENNRKRGQLDSLGQEIAIRLDGRARELKQDAKFQSELSKLGVSSKLYDSLIDLLMRNLFGVGVSLGVGGNNLSM